MLGGYAPKPVAVSLLTSYVPPQAQLRIYFKYGADVPEKQVKYLAFKTSNFPTVQP